MAYKLVIADIVEFPVKFTADNDGKTESFFFHLTGPRVPQAELRDLVDANDNRSIAEFLQSKITGWRGQRLVVGEDGKPAEFGPEALECMFSLVGLAGITLAAYMAACGAKGKN